MEIRKLNMLRGLAALCVVVSHYDNRTELFQLFLGDSAGQLGVMIFFILSGFLMSYLYMGKKEANPENIKRFAIARIARVFPLFLLIVLLSYGLPFVGVQNIFYHIPTIPSLISHLALLSGNSVLWTISTEIQFYLLFVLLWIVQAKRRFPLYAFFALVLLVLAFYGLPAPNFTVLGLSIDTKLVRSLPYFLVGVILGQVFQRWSPPQRWKSHAFAWSPLLIFALYPRIFLLLTGTRHFMWQDIGVFGVVTLVFFLITFFVPDCNRFFANAIGDFFGKISYSVYLLHLPVLHILLTSAQQQPALYFVPFLVITTVLSYLSYRFIEDPARNAIRSWATPLTYKPVK